MAGINQYVGRAQSYIFGRNRLVGIASLMLLVISGFATWSGMADFIIGAEGSGGEAVGRSIGGLEVTNNTVVIAIVIALTFLMWLALRESFGLERKASERAIMFPLYVFLALWSVGFGYGFWWSLIAGQEATKTSMAVMREDARDATTAIAARLEAVRIQLDSVVTWSESQMAREENSGGSCGVNSGRGRGPLYNARRSVRDSVASLRDNITNSWIDPVQRELNELRKTASSADAAADSLAERQAAFEARAAAIRSSARSIAARSNELGTSTAAEMRALADAVATKPGEPGFSCYDPTLEQRLRSAADQADQPAVLNLRDATFNEGPAGVANAVKNLWLNIGAAIMGGLHWISGGMIGEAPGEFDGTPITGRDLIALLATLGVDLGLFALTALNPPPRVRHEIPVEAREQIRKALGRASEIPGIDIPFIRKHLVHHKRKSYFVIPNLYSVNREDHDEMERALAMNKLAGVLDDLRVVRWPYPARRLFGGNPAYRADRADIVDEDGKGSRLSFLNPTIGKSELERLREEEALMSSRTDLSQIRRRLREQIPDDRADYRTEIDHKLQHAPLRNHGLFSKAEVALQTAGWSDKAQADIEVFVLTDSEGLTPLLEVLNDFERSGIGASDKTGEPQRAGADASA